MKYYKILIIDDDPDDHLFLKAAIKEMSMFIDVTCVFDGKQGLKYLELCETKPEDNKYPDLILCDINMPFTNGIQFLETAKNTENLKNIPICILTTSLDVETKQRLMSMGALDCFIKPIYARNYNTILADIFNRVSAFDDL